jgi:SAM-dependent methyltransferase
MRKLAQLVRRSVWLSAAYYLQDDWRCARRLARGRLETRSGRRHAALGLEESLAYIDRVHRDYLRYAEVERFTGNLVEIGPGDNFGVALCLLADGAESVHAIDRYIPRREPERQRRIYTALAERPGFRALFAGAADEGTIKGLVYRPGMAAERFFAGRGPSFDAVLSRAVLEHLADPLGALDDMARALRPGGRLVHRIDLRDHGMFAGHHPLTFLTPPEALYRRMSRASGRPNRVLYPAYRAWLARSGLEGTLRVSRLAGIESEFEPVPLEALEAAALSPACATVRAIRPRLARPFRALTDAELAVSGLVLVARKTAHATAASIS